MAYSVAYSQPMASGFADPQARRAIEPARKPAAAKTDNSLYHNTLRCSTTNIANFLLACKTGLVGGKSPHKIHKTKGKYENV
jgi:hypothetical protein